MEDVDRIGYRATLGEERGVGITKTKIIGLEAAIAINLVDHWGMTASIPDGEDSTGRRKERMATPEEVVDRAMLTASILYERLSEEGLLLTLPSLDELLATPEETGESQASPDSTPEPGDDEDTILDPMGR